MIDLFVPGEPVAQGRPKFRRFKGKGPDAKDFVSTYDPGTSRKWKAEITKAAKDIPPFPADMPLFVKLKFYLSRPKSVKRLYPTVKPDIDNFSKAVLDALKGIWKDDSQVVKISASKEYYPADLAAASPGVWIGIREYKE